MVDISVPANPGAPSAPGSDNPAAGVDTFNSLEELAILYADQASSGHHHTFESYIDTRFESTLNIVSRGVLKAFETERLGTADAVLGVVLNHNALPSTPANSGFGGNVSNGLLSAMGMVRSEPVAAARVMVIGTAHTEILPVPTTYGATAEDKDLISFYPLFYYSPSAFPIVPGSFVKCKFDVGTYQEGVVTEHVATVPPYVLSGQAFTPLAGNPEFATGTSLGQLLPAGGAGPTPNADRLRILLGELGPNIYEKGQELANGGDITAETAAAAASVMSTIRIEHPHIKIRITAGNDAFHHGLKCDGQGRRRSGAEGKCYTSRHTRGRGIDFVLASGRGAADSDLNRVIAILRRHVAGNAGKFRFVDEYRHPTSAATAPHIHFSWGEGSEGQDEWALAQASAAMSPWNSPIAVV